VRILLTDGDDRIALAAARSLGRAGHRVIVTASHARSLAGVSRHCRSEECVANAFTAPERFIADLEHVVARHRVDLLLPISEASMALVLLHRERFAGVTIPFGGFDAWLALNDKVRVLDLARSLGIDGPRYELVDSRGDVHELARRPRSYPVYVKPTRSTALGEDHRLLTSVVTRVRDMDELIAALSAVSPAHYPVMLQEPVHGQGVGIFLCRWRGVVVAQFGHRRIREFPRTGGVSVVRESVALDGDELAASAALLAALGWAGVAMLEFRRDSRTGRLVLMEINGRFWGSLQLAIDAGVDFPALLVQAATHGPEGPPPAYRTGVRSRWFWGDVDFLVQMVRERRAEGGTLRASVADFLRDSGPSVRSEVFRYSDPFPGLLESYRWIAPRILKRVGRGRGDA